LLSGFLIRFFKSLQEQGVMAGNEGEERGTGEGGMEKNKYEIKQTLRHRVCSTDKCTCACARTRNFLLPISGVPTVRMPSTKCNQTSFLSHFLLISSP
jgi:hypothetical protein